MRYWLVLIVFLSGCGIMGRSEPVVVPKSCPVPILACSAGLPDKSGKTLEVVDREVEIEFQKCRQAWIVWRDSLLECNEKDVVEAK